MDDNALKTYSALLIEIDEKLSDCLSQKPSQESDERLSFLETQKSDVASIQESFYRLVLTHPSVKEWFLRSEISAKDSSKYLKMRIVTKTISEIIGTAEKDKLEKVTAELEPFREKLTEISVHITTELKSKADSKITASCLRNMTKMLDTSQLLNVTESMLTLSSDVMVRDEALTDYGKSLLAVLKEYVSCLNRRSSSAMLSHSAFKSILTMTTGIADFDDVIRDLIDSFPSLVASVDEKYLHHCLEHSTQEKVSVMKLCLQLSPACRKWFCEWAARKKLKRVQLHKFAPLFQQFLASANVDGKILRFVLLNL